MRWLALCLLACAGIACAQQPANYPTRPIRLIVPFVPGGASDFSARIIQPKLAQELGQQIVIDNRGGAAGIIGVELAVRAPADGYTLLLTNVGTLTINTVLFRKLPYDPLRDLIGITGVSEIPGALAVHPSLPVASVKEFIEYAKARPGQLNYGSAGAQSTQRLVMEHLISKFGLSMVHVPYKGGAGPATTALLGGEVSSLIVTLASFIPHVKSGRVKILAVTTAKRSPSLQDVPTMAELGIHELRYGAWQSLHVPAKTPAPVVNKLQAAMARVLKDPWVLERFAAGGAEPLHHESPAAFEKFLKEQQAFWIGIVKRANITAE